MIFHDDLPSIEYNFGYNLHLPEGPRIGVLSHPLADYHLSISFGALAYCLKVDGESAYRLMS